MVGWVQLHPWLVGLMAAVTVFLLFALSGNVVWSWRRPARFARDPLVIDWYKITFDTEIVHLSVSPPGRESWEAKFRWDQIRRVCFETAGDPLFESDSIYVFIEGRENSYVVPMDGIGGKEFMDAILEHGLFDYEVAIEAMATHGQLFCWPPDDQSP